MQIAVWSGPRNISTALMYSFVQRKDFIAIDEPFYASYLRLTGLDHPMRDEVISSQSSDPIKVAVSLVKETGRNKPHVYQKHMTQHMVSGIPRFWMTKIRNVFLVRHPARVVASFAKKIDHPTKDDLGFEKQTELLRFLLKAGYVPIVVNSFELRKNPKKMLVKLCNALGLEFDPCMLTWSAGGSPYDGVWARHWYGAVHQSIGFSKPEGPLPDLKNSLRLLAENAMNDYEFMMDFCL